MPRPTGIALRTRGMLAGGQPGLDDLREAAGLLESCGAGLEHARALVELGAALRRANQRTAAREPLRRGLDLAYSCGAGRLAQRATDELRATGARPRRASLTGPEALTPSERRVAELAAGGMSNPEIAQAVFVTLNTVEGHLRHVYQKLRVSSRTELQAVLRSAAIYPPAPEAGPKATVAVGARGPTAPSGRPSPLGQVADPQRRRPLTARRSSASRDKVGTPPFPVPVRPAAGGLAQIPRCLRGANMPSRRDTRARMGLRGVSPSAACSSPRTVKGPRGPQRQARWLAPRVGARGASHGYRLA